MFQVLFIHELFLPFGRRCAKEKTNHNHNHNHNKNHLESSDLLCSAFNHDE